MVYILKGYKNDIFFEFLLQKKPADAIIFLAGFPNNNVYDELLLFFYKKGYHVFFPRYKGMYQSGGKFLEENIVKDINEFIKHIKKSKLKNLWDGREFTFSINKTFIFGSSFSGAIACGTGVFGNVDKLVLFSPVWDYNKHNKHGDEQDLNHLLNFVKKAYKNCYKIEFKNLFKKMKEIKEINSKFYLTKLKIPLLVLHDPSDKSVSIKHSEQFQKKFKFRLIKHIQGHGMSFPIISNHFQEITSFLKKK